jgi:hypothetical protein
MVTSRNPAHVGILAPGCVFGGGGGGGEHPMLAYPTTPAWWEDVQAVAEYVKGSAAREVSRCHGKKATQGPLPPKAPGAHDGSGLASVGADSWMTWGHLGVLATRSYTERFFVVVRF